LSGWLLEFCMPREKAKSVEDLLEAFGAQSVTLSASEDSGEFFEAAPGADPDWARLRMQASFPSELDIALLRAALTNVPGIEPAFEPLPERDWVRENRDSFTPIHVGGALWICPSWHSPPVAEAVNLVLDPGAAFGTGRHPTTLLCLRWLARNPPKGARVIDYGCGSGILAIAALKLGAREALGVDIDDLARETAAENAQRNGVGAAFRVQAPGGEIAAGEVVLANILADTLIELADELTRLTLPGGRILLSGILKSQAGTVQAAYAGAFDLLCLDHEGWSLLIGQRVGDRR
jgi:ribosomal protein L11 methyltransferase